MFPQTDVKTKERIILYIDIIMFIIAILSTYFMVLNFYRAGYHLGIENYIDAQSHLMYAGASIAFLSVAMMWIFIRFFRNWGKRVI